MVIVLKNSCIQDPEFGHDFIHIIIPKNSVEGNLNLVKPISLFPSTELHEQFCAQWFHCTISDNEGTE